MNLSPSQTLTQEALIGRIQRTAQEIQKNPPKQQPNAIEVATAAFAATYADDEETINGFVGAMAFLMLNEFNFQQVLKELEAAKEQANASGDQPEVEEIHE